MMWWYGDHMNGWGYTFMGLGSLLFWALLILGGIAMFRYLTRTSGPGAPTVRSAPEQLLAERYARGEIGDEEYHHMLDILRGSRPTAVR